MSNIKLARIDFRLMHGQVVTTWISQVSANAILIVDDKLAADKFLAQVFLMAAPPGIKVAIKSIEKAIQGAKTGLYNGLDLIVLFKSVENAKKAIEGGFPISELQVGGLGSGVDKLMISNEIGLNENEISILKTISEKFGVNISLQVTPKDPLVTLDEAIKEFNRLSKRGK